MDALEVRIKELLLDIGVDPALSGYRYLVDSLAACYADGSLLQGVTKQLYPSIAKRFKTGSSQVERSVRYAIANIDKINPKGLDRLRISPTVTRKHFTNTQFFAACIECLKMEETKNKC